MKQTLDTAVFLINFVHSKKNHLTKSIPYISEKIYLKSLISFENSNNKI